MTASKKSVSGLLTLLLGLDDPNACFHQTLTFFPPLTDQERARALLNKLLDNICRRYEMVCLSIQEDHASGAIHFHILLLFYDEVAAKLEQELKEALWQAWNSLQKKELVRQANRFRRYDEDFKDRMKPIRYFLLENDRLKIGKPDNVRWWGCRNHRLIAQHCKPVKRGTIAKVVKQKLREQVPIKFDITKRLPFTKRAMEKERAWIVSRGGVWENHKRQMTGRSGKVTNKEYLEFRNQTEFLL